MTAALLPAGTGAAHAVAPPDWVAVLYIEAQKAVGLRWAPAAGATGYRVMRGTTAGAGFEEIASTNTPQFFDTHVEPGKTYYYVLQSVTGAEVSADSPEKMVKIPGRKKVAVIPPKWVKVSAKQKTEFGKVTFKVHLAWVKYPNPAIVAYNVYRSETKGRDYRLVGAVPEASYVDTAVARDRTYYYVLSALDNAFQETPMSEEREITLTFRKAVKKKRNVPNPKLNLGPSRQEFIIRGHGPCSSPGESGSERLELATLCLPTDLAVDSEGNIYSADAGLGTVQVFAPDGTYVRTIGERGQEKGQMQYPTGIGLDSSDNVYVTDRAARPRVVAYDKEGRFIREVVIPPPTAEYMAQFEPKDLQPLVRDVAVGRDGRIYVVDNQLHRLLIFDREGELLKEAGGPGKEQGRLNAPGWLAIHNGEVHVTNGLNRRIEVFDRDGNFVRKYGESKTFIGSFVGPTGITFDDLGRSLVVDTSAATIQYFGPGKDDPETWEYKFTMAGEDVVPDRPRSRSRARWQVRNPSGIVYSPVTGMVLFILSLDRSIMARRLFATDEQPSAPVLTEAFYSGLHRTVDLQWKPSKEALVYSIFRKSPNETTYREIGTSKVPYYFDRSMRRGETYSYRVTAKGYRLESEASLPVEVNTAESAGVSAPPATPGLSQSTWKPSGSTIPGLSWKNYPRVSGSTSTRPLGELVMARVLGIPGSLGSGFPDRGYAFVPASDPPAADWRAWSEGGEKRKHLGTHGSYKALIEGHAEVILVARTPSPDEISLAAERKRPLDVRPVATDAFVFLVNAANAVTSLTMDQVRDIYAGKAINWKDVGGNVEPIQAYSRNRNSGSQELMEKLVMKGAPMLDLPDNMLPSMGAPISAVASRENAIAYSVYFYEQFMNRNERNRLIGINGTVPTSATIATGAYPLTTDVYVVISTDSPADSPARILRDWLLSKEGQAVVRESGYVPVAD